MKSSLSNYLLRCAANHLEDHPGAPVDDSFYQDALNIASENYASKVARLGFCYRTLCTSIEINYYASQATSNYVDQDSETAFSAESAAVPRASTKAEAIYLLVRHSLRYGLGRCRQTLQRLVFANTISPGHIATASIAVLVVASLWLPFSSKEDTDSQYRGQSQSATTNTVSVSSSTQTANSVLLLNSLLKDLTFREKIKIEANHPMIDVFGELTEKQMTQWKNEVLKEYEQRGGSLAALNENISVSQP